MQKALDSPRHKALIRHLIKARQDAGLTQAELANKLGEYQSFVVRLESGQRRIDIVELLEITEALSINLSRLIGGLERNKTYRQL